MKKYLILIGILAVIAIVVVIGLGRKKPVMQEEFVRLVSISDVTAGNVELHKQFYGLIRSMDQTEIYPDVPGKFIRYTVKEGGRVSKDQTIAEIDRSIPGMQFETAKVKAPIDGIIYDLSFMKGQPVMPQAPVANISNPDNLIVRIDVSKDILDQVQRCINADIYVGDKKYTGRVVRKSYFPNNMTHLGSIDIVIDNGSKQLVNRECRAFLYTDVKENTTRIPVDAYKKKNGSSYVFKFSNGTAVKTDVKAGIIGNEFVEIIEGLQKGDTVITIGSDLVRDNQTVRTK